MGKKDKKKSGKETSTTAHKTSAAKVRKPRGGSGEIYTRADGKYAFRVKASNGQIVASSQGYIAKTDARSTLTSLMTGGYDGPIVEV